MEIKDLKAVELMCKEMGWTFKKESKTYKWYDRFVDDTPIPDSMFTAARKKEIEAMTSAERMAIMTKALGKCDHEIVIPNACYTVGLAKQPNGAFHLRLDWYSAGGLSYVLGGEKAPILKQAYAVAKAKLEAKKNGFKVVSQKKDKNGWMELRLAR